MTKDMTRLGLTSPWSTKKHIPRRSRISCGRQGNVIVVKDDCIDEVVRRNSFPGERKASLQLVLSSELLPLAVTNPADDTAIRLFSKYACPCLPKIKSTAPCPRATTTTAVSVQTFTVTNIPKLENAPQCTHPNKPAVPSPRAAYPENQKTNTHKSQRDLQIGLARALESPGRTCLIR